MCQRRTVVVARFGMGKSGPVGRRDMRPHRAGPDKCRSGSHCMARQRCHWQRGCQHYTGRGILQRSRAMCPCVARTVPLHTASQPNSRTVLSTALGPPRQSDFPRQSVVAKHRRRRPTSQRRQQRPRSRTHCGQRRTCQCESYPNQQHAQHRRLEVQSYAQRCNYRATDAQQHLHHALPQPLPCLRRSN